ncbi:hypothetical protein FNV43_RR22466 [Rhamnella rubrinervis]|uniref:Alpha/beta hydrolase fold-3 domain-containing protein n=1 Tax=Rhamnella rubrinervis TaxID=2594499 RepID=A0A8K0DQA0_9ROSA|nr:hypothetical protein FNV43_RR22466 [Rhamnella rubrinervis]
MDATTDEIIFNFENKFQIYKSGRIERFKGEDIVPSSPDSDSGVRSKDVVISPQTGLSGRLFIPQITDSTTGKLSFLLYIHGGAFCIDSPSVPPTTTISPVGSCSPKGDGPEEWLNYHADFQRVFVAGDSAGATLTHTVVLRAGIEGVSGLRIIGMILFHPFFTNDDEPDRLVEIIFPSSSGPNDPMLNPGKDPKLGRLGCGKMLIFVAEKDSLRDRGWNYFMAVKESGWGGGSVEIVETEGEGHVFHLFDPDSDKAMALMEKTVSFFKKI